MSIIQHTIECSLLYNCQPKLRRANLHYKTVRIFSDMVLSILCMTVFEKYHSLEITNFITGKKI
jgi:hypothetical protein